MYTSQPHEFLNFSVHISYVFKFSLEITILCTDDGIKSEKASAKHILKI